MAPSTSRTVDVTFSHIRVNKYSYKLLFTLSGSRIGNFRESTYNPTLLY